MIAHRVVGSYVLAGVWLAVSLLYGMTTAPVLASSASLDGGRRVYAEKQCALCHTLGGTGGTVGPELTHVGAQRDATWLKRFLKAPQAVNPKSRMPPFTGSDQDLEALVAYLGSLK